MLPNPLIPLGCINAMVSPVQCEASIPLKPYVGEFLGGADALQQPLPSASLVKANVGHNKSRRSSASGPVADPAPTRCGSMRKMS